MDMSTQLAARVTWRQKEFLMRNFTSFSNAFTFEKNYVNFLCVAIERKKFNRFWMLSQKKFKKRFFSNIFFLLDRKTLECCSDEGSLETESIFFLTCWLIKWKTSRRASHSHTDSLSSVVNVFVSFNLVIYNNTHKSVVKREKTNYKRVNIHIKKWETASTCILYTRDIKLHNICWWDCNLDSRVAVHMETSFCRSRVLIWCRQSRCNHVHLSITGWN